MVGHAVLAPSHTTPAPPHAAAFAFGENVHAPVASQPVHAFSQVPAAGVQAPAQQLLIAPAPLSAPQGKPDAHARQLACLQFSEDPPAVVSQLAPFATREMQVPAPLQ